MASAELVEECRVLCRWLTVVDGDLRRRAKAEPPPELLHEAGERFVEWLRRLERSAHDANLDFSDVQFVVDQELGPILWRSKCFWRARWKPQGYAGDFLMLENFYDLEHSAGCEPQQAALANVLDYCFSLVHSVIGVWSRRRWLASLVRQSMRRREGCRVLDFASGGGRYLVDALTEWEGPPPAITLLDQDPAAIHFAAERLRATGRARVTEDCSPIKNFEAARQTPFDLVISSGLFDYLDERTATHTALELLDSVAPDGSLAITNLCGGDRSAFFASAVVDWPLIRRDARQMRSLFPEPADVEIRPSEDGSMLFSLARRNDSKA